MAKNQLSIKMKMNCYLKKIRVEIALIGALANDKTLGSWRVQLMTKVLFQYWKDFKSINKLNYVKGADVVLEELNSYGKLKLISKVAFQAIKLQQSRLS
jgi:hypothetical protein